MEESEKIISIASDHAGYELKEYIAGELREAGFGIKDYGAFSNESVDYPEIVHPLGKDINEKIIQKGIVICGSGNGVQMTVNKYPNVRCALCWGNEIALLARKHNDANILALPARFISKKEAMQMVKTFMNTDFEGGRHQIRVSKINELL